MERTYRPALDDKAPTAFNDSSNQGLGLAPMGAATAAAAAGEPPKGGYRGMRPTNTAATSPVPPLSANPMMPQRAFSFTEERGPAVPAAVEQERIRRKPLPTIGTGGGGSPLMGSQTPTGADGAEPWLPGGAQR